MPNPPPREQITPVSDADRRRSLRDTLAAAPGDGILSVFAYGSLMWNPCFGFVERRTALLRDFHRGFSIWSVFSRGTPEAPGLGFALEARAGATCEGILYRLPAETAEQDLVPLWEREMWTDTYRPTWVRVETETGGAVALTFVARPDHPNYAGDMPIAEKARYIARAAGKYGRCRDYLAESVAALKAHDIADAELEALLDAVETLGC